MFSRACRKSFLHRCVNLNKFGTFGASNSTLSSNCWKCGFKLPKQFCMFCNSCNKVQKINVDNVNYFDIFGLKSIYKMDSKVLESAFKHLQNVIHPDKFNNESSYEKEVSIFNSSFINQAYSVLKSPVERIAYLLSTNGCDVLSENSGTYIKNPALMIEIFDLREDIDKLSNCNELEVKREEIIKIVGNLSSEIEILWDCDDVSRVVPHAVRMKYLYKVHLFYFYFYFLIR